MIIDLAVHDLDIIRYITQSEVIRLYAETEKGIHNAHEDIMTGIIRLSDGTIGSLSINWITRTKICELSVIGQRGMFKVDYLTQDLYFYENGYIKNSDWNSMNILRGVSEGKVIRYFIEKKEHTI